MSDIVRVRLEEDVRPGMRLGRAIHHDPRSRAYAVEAAPLSALRSVRHRRLVPPYQQGDTGSCTGNACAGVLSTRPYRHRFGQPTARRIYSAATQLDPFAGSWPPVDTGSDGLSVAKVAVARGWATGYDHAFSLEAALTALQTSAVMVGIAWRSGLDTPDPDGFARYVGRVRGGHEFVADEVDINRRVVGCTQSWGPRWGAAGRFYLSFDDLGTALDDQGDVTVLR